MNCALAEWQHTRPTQLHQVVDELGFHVEYYRNKHIADRAAAGIHGHTVQSIDLSSATHGDN